MKRAPRAVAMGALTLAAHCLLACGGQSSSDAHGGASSTGGNASGGVVGSGGSAGQPSGGTSSGGATCDPVAYADNRGWSVTVIIANQTSQAIHLGQSTVTCGISPLFEVREATGMTLPALGDCRQACESVLRGSGVGCPALCRFPESITLAPGESTSVAWSGLFSRSASVPLACLPKGQFTEDAVCDLAREIVPGTYRFVATAGTALDCSLTIGTCGACEAGSLGGCKTSAALIAGTMLSAEVTVALDASYGVGLRTSGNDGATVPVEITFKD